MVRKASANDENCVDTRSGHSWAGGAPFRVFSVGVRVDHTTPIRQRRVTGSAFSPGAPPFVVLKGWGFDFAMIGDMRVSRSKIPTLAKTARMGYPAGAGG
jgi:hypothetical protein